MNEFKGTPGPWIVVNGDDNFPDIISGNRNGIEIAFTPTYNGDKSEQLANAYLIASAPRLLEVAISLLEALESENPLSHSDTINLARAEIAKALGESK